MDVCHDLNRSNDFRFVKVEDRECYTTTVKAGRKLTSRRGRGVNNIFPPALNTMAEPEQAPEQPKATVQKQIIGM